ncbi:MULTISPECIES: hypothetical protein [Bacillus cereus group]|uniref:Uncharacterized protein n=2 Tax=root TaxID=1 RepID=A0A1B1P7A5_9CAUD|nr:MULTISPECIES: hypothetical protein [Bacillus cereus group]YP_009830690.1 hypothetical protein HWA95_gp36 [Bacillus phage vB_BtS_BMBtp14]HDX9541054.1 hypothetical protein [Bacillus thuringiensis]ANT39996.1 hypothetical protein BMBtpLA2_36 [Bacillus phage vB_BtS_BMBtp14]EEM55880.1 hypothetical protein bthur0007_63400 [Bacillus thuringiensis serovar monterrey BGSC 4AJ1]MEB9673592.1 hypothetical protein [Bacillus anthracis]OKA19958.1 hypothetical protein BJR05_26810 [Bacillus cereus]
MSLLGKRVLVVIEGVLSCGVVASEYQYNVVLHVDEYSERQVVDKENIVKTLNESAVERLKELL